MPSDPPPEDPDRETRAVIERAERNWQQQVEREEQGLDYPGRMTPFRWTMLIIAIASLILLIVTR
ncbi:MAG TPA: hypothetical protein VGG57_10755 [Stellaceae bacterium]|jgi:hypothetical protein